MTVNVKATFKKDQSEYNGLVTIEEALIANPHVPHTIVAVVECTKITRDIADGTVTPTIRLRLVEVVQDADSDQARSMLERSFSVRTNRPAPPATLFDAASPTPERETVDSASGTPAE